MCLEARLFRSINVRCHKGVVLHGLQELSGCTIEPGQALGKHALEEAHVPAALELDVGRQGIALEGVDKSCCGLIISEHFIPVCVIKTVRIV